MATRWDSFSESSTCGDPYTRTPFVSRTGWLSDAERILGPFGTYFGRSLAEVKAELVWWTVPGSGGKRTRVHRAMIADLRQVAATLSSEASRGRVYPITSVAGFTPRTIGGSHQLSRHALGLAIDINPGRNPFRADNRLTTNMPGWFVDAWREAGFCWGGDWRFSKDPMHFSWIGPGSSRSLAGPVTPRGPKTVKKPFGSRVASHDTEFAPVMARYLLGVADGTGNGAPDVIGVRSHPGGSVIDISSSTYRYGRCSVSRWFVDDSSLAGSDLIVVADIDGDSGQDLIALKSSGGRLAATMGTRRAEFDDLSVSQTGLAASSRAVTAADFDGDGTADLWEATTDGRIRVWRGPAMTSLTHESTLPGGTPVHIAAGDTDGGDTPELFTLVADGGGSRIDVQRLDGTWKIYDSIQVSRSATSISALGAGDYDGDGRADAQALVGDGALDVFVGNTTTGGAVGAWFADPEPDCRDPVLLAFRGSFFDDEDSIFESNIESIAASGVTRGCNPPFRDRFCPKETVTRETMAAFLVRALNLTENTHPGFRDVAAGTTFAEDIGRLATAGITRGCNPPLNDLFCPENDVTRETMAAFLVRALGLSEDTHPGFADIAPGNIFSADIEMLATAGITRGCNPPVNDMFCPKDAVTRETMAAFLDRAGLGG